MKNLDATLKRLRGPDTEGLRPVELQRLADWEKQNAEPPRSEQHPWNEWHAERRGFIKGMKVASTAARQSYKLGFQAGYNKALFVRK